MNGSDDEVTPEQLMRVAISMARRGIAAGQSPFGCAIAIDGRLLASAHNTVLATTDVTAHAEVNALRIACRELNRIALEGAIVASTCEPCPMCMAALHWARVECVYFGATIADAHEAGFNELELPAAELLRQGGSSVRLVAEWQRDDCRQLFADWNSHPNHRAY